MYIGKTPTVGNFQVCDAISVVNGQAAYTLQVGGVNVAPESANHMLVSLNGILQKPGSSFTISSSTMTFASNLAPGEVIDFVQILGNVLDIGQPSDDTVTAAKINNDVISGQTALAAIPADTDELLISDAGTIKRIDYSLIKPTNTPAFEAYGAEQSGISSNTWTKITFGTEVFDTAGEYDHSTNYRFTPQTAGKYFVYAGFSMYSETAYKAYVFNMAIYKNGSSYRYTPNNANPSYDESERFVTANSTVVMNGSSDYVEIYGRCVTESGTVLFDSREAIGFFGAYKIIE